MKLPLTLAAFLAAIHGQTCWAQEVNTFSWTVTGRTYAVQYDPCSSYTDASVITNKVYTLSGNFKYSKEEGYQAPSSATQPAQAILNDIGNAWKAAPRRFADALCSLAGIFILTGTSDLTESWGYRETPRQQAQTGLAFPRRYIGLSATLWPSNTPMTLGVYETGLIQALTGWGNSNLKFDEPTQPFSGQMVLAALAHEFGHILFHDLYNPTTKDFDFDNFCGDSLHIGWRDYDHRDRFRDFMEQDGEQNLRSNARLTQLQAAVSQQLWRKAQTLIGNVHAARSRWASLFATFSPEEDFVETFRLFILTHPSLANKLTSLKLHIPRAATTATGDITYDLPADLAADNKPVLKRKMNCFIERFPPNPP